MTSVGQQEHLREPHDNALSPVKHSYWLTWATAFSACRVTLRQSILIHEAPSYIQIQQTESKICIVTKVKRLSRMLGLQPMYIAFRHALAVAARSSSREVLSRVESSCWRRRDNGRVFLPFSFCRRLWSANCWRTPHTLQDIRFHYKSVAP